MAELMKDGSGAPVLRNGNPVILHDGQELVVEVEHFPGLLKSRASMGELRTKLETAEAKLQVTEAELAKFGRDGDERAKTLTLAGKAKAFDDKKLIDAGESEKVVAERTATMKEKYDAQITQLEAKLSEERAATARVTIDGPFAAVSRKGGPFDSTQWSPTASLVKAEFAKQFRVENGAPVAYKRLPGTKSADDPGEKVYNAQGDVASFDEALAILRDLHPERDDWKRHTATGPGSPGAPNPISITNFDALSKMSPEARLSAARSAGASR